MYEIRIFTIMARRQILSLISIVEGKFELNMQLPCLGHGGEREEWNEGVGGVRGELIFYHAHYLLLQTHLNQFISVLSLL